MSVWVYGVGLGVVLTLFDLLGGILHFQLALLVGCALRYLRKVSEGLGWIDILQGRYCVLGVDPRCLMGWY